MNKIDFPLGVELPLRGGQSAVLLEFFEGRWYGRIMGTDKWYGEDWGSNGEIDLQIPQHGLDIVWTPPKRKVWVIWGIDFAPTITCDKSAIAAGYATRGHKVQEVEES